MKKVTIKITDDCSGYGVLIVGNPNQIILGPKFDALQHGAATFENIDAEKLCKMIMEASVEEDIK